MTVLATLLAYDPSQVKPGSIALFIVLALAVATFFLIRSMLKRVKGINFDEHPDDPARNESGEDAGDADHEDPPSGPRTSE